jgi:phosphoenolpyruvate synthase/pyruvate phosphate dikinase
VPHRAHVLCRRPDLAVREMILANDEAGRRKALAKLLPMQRGDFEGMFREMNGLPVTIRLLDPPLHEFIPHDEAGQRTMANEMGVPLGKIKMRVEELHEFNPMMGHRGCRLGISYPEITEMQARAVIEAALNMKARALKSRPRSWCRWSARCANSTPRQRLSARPPPPCLPSAASNWSTCWAR